MKTRLVSILVLFALILVGCKSYPRMKKSLSGDPSLVVQYKPGELKISKDLSKNLLSEFVGKTGSQKMPDSFSTQGDLVVEAFRGYPLKSVSRNDGGDAAAQLRATLEVDAYYKVDKKTQMVTLVLRSNFLLHKNKTNKQIRWVPKLAQLRESKKYNNLSFSEFTSLLPPADYLEAFKALNRKKLAQMIATIKKS